MLNHATGLFGKADSTQSYVRSPSCYLYSLGAVSVEHTWTVPLWFSPLVRLLPWPESWNRNGMTASIPGKWQLLTVIDMCGNGFGYLPGNSWRLLTCMAMVSVTCHVWQWLTVIDMAILDGYWHGWQYFRLLATRPIWPTRFEPSASPWKTI